jgi:nucleoside-diphosphate-sugar epimerase
LLARLAATGRPAIAVCRRPLPTVAPAADWLAWDLTRPLDLGGRRPVAAVHATGAWLLPPQLGPLAAAGVRRLVCFSSTSLLAKAASPSAAERDIVARLVAAEAAVAACRTPWIVLRPSLIYGLGLDANVSAAARFIRRWRFFPLGGPGRGLRQPVHADDLAAAALAALTSEGLSGRFNLGGGETLTYRAMIERIFDALGLRPRFLGLPLLARLPGHTGAMVARMEQDLAFDDGSSWRQLGLAPRRFLADGPRDLGPSA